MDFKSLEEIKGSVKKSLINYYKDVTSEIDVAAQEILIKHNNKLTDAERKNVDEIYKQLIEKTELCSNSTMDDINKYFDDLEKLQSLFADANELNTFFEDNSNVASTKACHKLNLTSGMKLNQPMNELTIDENNVKLFGIKHYCLFINKSDLNPNLNIKERSPLGVFISFDWYPNQNQLNQIKSIFQKPHDNPVYQYEFDEVYCLNFRLGLDKLIKESKVKLNNIYEIKKQDLTLIESVKINLICHESRNILKFNSDVFKNLSNLRTLEINSTKQNFKLVDGIKKFTNDSFDLNTDSNIIQAVNKLHNLKILKLKKCSIKDLSENVFYLGSPFHSMSNLEELDLSTNKIEKICSRTFDGLFSVKKLDLGYNKLSELQNFPFALLENLVTLNLSGNLFQKLYWNSFGRDLKNLENIYLYDCTFQSIQYKTFSYLNKLKEISLPPCFAYGRYKFHMGGYGLKPSVNKIYNKSLDYYLNDENNNNDINNNNIQIQNYDLAQILFRPPFYFNYFDFYEDNYYEDDEYEDEDGYEYDDDHITNEEEDEDSGSDDDSSVIEINMERDEEIQ